MTPESPEFAALLREIQNRPQPIGPQTTVNRDSAAAVLLNQSGKAIIALAYVWRFTTATRRVRTSRHSNLGSSIQMDVLTGRTGVVRDRFSFILPGSKRLITVDGMFGDNFDVLPSESAPTGGGFMGAVGRGGMRRGADEEEIIGTELGLDTVFFEDGLCVGPDEFGLFESVTEEIRQQHRVAQEILEALRKGEAIGRVFEILRPLACRTRPAARQHDRNPSGLLSMFANTAIHHLVNMSDPELLAWFEVSAQPSRIPLHRPI